MLTYQSKDNLIFNLHPFTQIVFVAIVFILSLIFSHPLYLLGLLISVGVVIAAAGSLNEWKGYMKFSVIMVVVIVLVNALFAHAGTTIIVQGPVIPFLGSLEISWEALIYGLSMSIRLLVIISIFCFFTYAVNPDKALKLFSRLGGKSVLAIILSVRLFPLMLKDFQRITDIQRCRGVNLTIGNWRERARNSVPIISILLLSSIERSLQLAESMYTRGYGSGSRSNYDKELWRPRDYLLLPVLAFALSVGIGSSIMGWSDFNFYPVLDKIAPYELAGAGIIVLALLTPAILNWGWIKWPILKSKI